MSKDRKLDINMDPPTPEEKAAEELEDAKWGAKRFLESHSYTVLSPLQHYQVCADSRELARRNGVVLCPHCFGGGGVPAYDTQGCDLCKGAGEISVNDYREHVARLARDSRELAAMREGGGWLKRWTGEPDSYGDFLHLCKYTGEWMTYRRSRNPDECDPDTKKPEDDEIVYGPIPQDGDGDWWAHSIGGRDDAS